MEPSSSGVRSYRQTRRQRQGTGRDGASARASSPDRTGYSECDQGEGKNQLEYLYELLPFSHLNDALRRTGMSFVVCREDIG